MAKQWVDHRLANEIKFPTDRKANLRRMQWCLERSVANGLKLTEKGEKLLQAIVETLTRHPKEFEDVPDETYQKCAGLSNSGKDLVVHDQAIIQGKIQ